MINQLTGRRFPVDSKGARDKVKSLLALMRREKLFHDGTVVDIQGLTKVLTYRTQYLAEIDHGKSCTPTTLLNQKLVTEWPEKMVESQSSARPQRDSYQDGGKRPRPLEEVMADEW